MFDENLAREIIQELGEKYPTSESRKNLRLNEDLINEIFLLLESKNYEIVSSPDFPTENFSATALEQFAEPIRQWVQIVDKDDYYIPTEQMIRDLISQGWVIRPPRGV